MEKKFSQISNPLSQMICRTSLNLIALHEFISLFTEKLKDSEEMNYIGILRKSEGAIFQKDAILVKTFYLGEK